MKDAVQEHARDDFRAGRLGRTCGGNALRRDRLRRRRGPGRVASLLAEARRGAGTAGNRLYYLAVPPGAFQTIVRELGKRRGDSGLDAAHRREAVRPRPRRRHGAEHDAHAALRRGRVFRIDHYLGKETVQNMLALRFANGIFEPIWNRQFIDHVQITVAESIGIEGRAGFYEQAGRDPRHLPEPPAAAARADRDGAADRLHGRVGAQREGEGAEGAAHAGPEVGRPRPVRARLRRGRGGARRTARRRASRRTR